MSKTKTEKCGCISSVNQSLSKNNLTLRGIAFQISRATGFNAIPYIQTDWIDVDKAPKGKKKSPPVMYASHCPWCGIEYPKTKKA